MKRTMTIGLLIFILAVLSVNALQPSLQVECCFDSQDENEEIDESFLGENCPELELNKEKCEEAFKGWEKTLEELVRGDTGLETCYDENFVNYPCDDPNLCYDETGMVIDCRNYSKIILVSVFIIAIGIILWRTLKKKK